MRSFASSAALDCYIQRRLVIRGLGSSRPVLQDRNPLAETLLTVSHSTGRFRHTARTHPVSWLRRLTVAPGPRPRLHCQSLPRGRGGAESLGGRPPDAVRAGADHAGHDEQGEAKNELGQATGALGDLAVVCKKTVGLQIHRGCCHWTFLLC